MELSPVLALLLRTLFLGMKSSGGCKISLKLIFKVGHHWHCQITTFVSNQGIELSVPPLCHNLGGFGCHRDYFCLFKASSNRTFIAVSVLVRRSTPILCRSQTNVPPSSRDLYIAVSMSETCFFKDISFKNIVLPNVPKCWSVTKFCKRLNQPWNESFHFPPPPALWWQCWSKELAGTTLESSTIVYLTLRDVSALVPSSNLIWN